MKIIHNDNIWEHKELNIVILKLEVEVKNI